MTDAFCRPVALLLTGGQVADCTAADALLDQMPVGVHPTMIHQWKKALLDGASHIFARGRVQGEPEVDAARVKELHAKIGKLTVARDPRSSRGVAHSSLL